MDAQQLTIPVGADHVTALYLRPPNAKALYLFAHGAGAGMSHKAMESNARGLAERGKKVALVESGLVGGECPYLACMPSKALLSAMGTRSWAEAVRFRDEVAEHRDDSGAAKSLQDRGVTLVRERGVVTGPSTVLAGNRELTADHLILCTGAEASPPPIEGIDSVDFWTSEDALASDELPASLLVLGGGPVGCELAQVYARFGAQVTVIEPGDRLLPSEPEPVGEALAEALRRDGVAVRVGIEAQQVRTSDGGVEAQLSDDSSVTAARLLVATGKKPRVEGLGLRTIGVEPTDDGAIPTDDRCRVKSADGAIERLWAAGDVTAIAPFTHTANYQAKIVVANICGEDRRADYRAIPRVVYTDPAVFCVGRTDDELQSASYRIAETARAVVAERQDGSVTLFADGGRLVGAACVGPDADHWGAELTVAVRAEIDLSVLRDVVHAFPTFGEALEPVYDELCQGSSDEGTR